MRFHFLLSQQGLLLYRSHFLTTRILLYNLPLMQSILQLVGCNTTLMTSMNEKSCGEVSGDEKSAHDWRLYHPWNIWVDKKHFISSNSWLVEKSDLRDKFTKKYQIPEGLVWHVYRSQKIKQRTYWGSDDHIKCNSTTT